MSFDAPQQQLPAAATPTLETTTQPTGQRVGKRPKPKNPSQTFLGEAGAAPGPSSGAQPGSTLLGSAA